MKLKTISLILCIIFIFTLSACGEKKDNGISLKKTPTESSEYKAHTVNLLYTKSDSFNPYTAATESNRNITKLIFEPLFKTDPYFNAIPRVASGISFDRNICYVTIKPTVFSDGTNLTAEDVVYSYRLAKNSSVYYQSHLYEVVSCSAVDTLTVCFTLSQYDPYFANMLDFPIIKSGSENIKNSDGVLLSPIGCGRYIPDSENEKLVQNPTFFGDKGEITEIRLINAPDSDSLSHYIEVGASEMYYNDLSSGAVVRMSGSRVAVNLNNFVYLGINSSNPYLQNKNMRYAISSAINRKAICSDAFYNNATVANGFFNSSLEEVRTVQSLKDKEDAQITVENLNIMGYNSIDTNGFYVDANGKRPVLRLIVNSENRSRVVAANLISAQLRAMGIEINVSELSFNQYLLSLQTGAFDLYLGEISVLQNFDLSNLVLAGGSCAYGVGLEPPLLDENGNPLEKENPIKNILDSYHGGNSSIGDVAGVLLTEMPQIPICYRQGLFFYKDEIKSGVISTENDIYYSIENYKF